MVGVEEALARAVAERGAADLADIGGERALWADKHALVSSRLLPELSRMVCTAWERLERRDLAIDLLLGGVESTTSALILANMLDVVLGCPAILAEAGNRFARILLVRAEERHEERTASVAAVALDGATRLAVGEWTSRFLLLDTLTRISDNERDLFATPATRLVGVCYEQWRVPELLPVLEQLLTLRGAEGDAAYELGMAALLDALYEGSEDAVLSGLRRARTWLARSEVSEEERTDAAVYGLAIDVLLAFVGGQPKANVESTVDRLREHMRQRHLWLFGLHQSWLSPRYQAEAEWLRLSVLLRVAAANVERRSWLQPRAALAQTLEA